MISFEHKFIFFHVGRTGGLVLNVLQERGLLQKCEQNIWRTLILMTNIEISNILE
jgi:hypothetical protein